MSQFSEQIFNQAVGELRQHARETMRDLRIAEAKKDLTHVWLLWGNNAVLGVFKTEEAAVETLNLLSEHVRGRVERRMVGD